MVYMVGVNSNYLGDNLINIENTIDNFAETLYKVVNVTINLVKRSICKEVPYANER